MYIPLTVKVCLEGANPDCVPSLTDPPAGYAHIAMWTSLPSPETFTTEFLTVAPSFKTPQIEAPKANQLADPLLND